MVNEAFGWSITCASSEKPLIRKNSVRKKVVVVLALVVIIMCLSMNNKDNDFDWVNIQIWLRKFCISSIICNFWMLLLIMEI